MPTRNKPEPNRVLDNRCHGEYASYEKGGTRDVNSVPKRAKLGAIAGVIFALVMGIPAWNWNGSGDLPELFTSYCDLQASFASVIPDNCVANGTGTTVIVLAFAALGAITFTLVDKLAAWIIRRING